MGSIFKSFISLFCIFILAILVIGFLLPRENTISVSKTVSGSSEKIFPLINDLKNWEKWSPWQEYDPTMKIIYSQNTIGKDAWYSWRGNINVGYGKLTILDSKPNVKIETLLNYEDQTPAKGSFVLTPIDIGTDVIWKIEFQQSNNSFLAKFFGGYKYLLMKFFLEKDFNKGLDNLNKAVQ
jgi:hypothetical protein